MEQKQFVGWTCRNRKRRCACVANEAGKILWQGKCKSSPEAMTAITRYGRSWPKH